MVKSSRSASVGAQHRAIGKRAATRAETLVKKSLTDLSSAIIRDTPVDTGRARGNWVPGFGSVNMGQGGIDKTGAATTAKIAGAINGIRLGTVFYFTNTLPYIGVLEYGGYPGIGPKTIDMGDGIFSTQADRGMVRVNVFKFRDTVGKAVRAL